MNIDEELRAALRPESAPPDFAKKLLAKTRPAPRYRAVFALAATLAAIAIIPSAIYEHHRREEARAMKAKQDLFVALTITRTHIQQTRALLERISKPETRYTP